MKSLRRITSVLVLCSICLAYLPARAEEEPWNEVIIFGALVLADSGFAIIGLLSIIINGIHISKDERPSGGSLFMGYLMGSLNILAGIGMLATSKGEHEIAIGFGTASILLGSGVIGVTIWASTKPERPEQKLTLAPMIMPDVRGQPAVGVGLRLVNW